VSTIDLRGQKVGTQYNAVRDIHIHENNSRIQQNQTRSINLVSMYVPMPSTVYTDSITHPPASPAHAMTSTDTISDWGNNEMFSDSGWSSIDGFSHDLVATTDMSTNLDSVGIDYDICIFGSDFSLPSI
jgi:hypothetical protein